VGSLRASATPVGFGDYLDLEVAATQICSYSAQTVPSLLQTEDYAAAVYRTIRPDLTNDQLRSLVTLQLRRQEAVIRNPKHRLDMIIDESVLMRSIGPPGVTLNQCDHLLSVTAESSVTVRVVALGTRQPALSPSFTILSFTDSAIPDLASGTHLHGQVLLTRDETRVGTMRRTFTMLGNSASPLRRYHRRSSHQTSAYLSRPSAANHPSGRRGSVPADDVL
jgi:hypothetical protein